MEPAIPTLLRSAGDALIGLYRRAPGFEARLTRDTWLVASGEAHPHLNWIAAIEPGRATQLAVREHVAWMRARGLPALVFLVPAVAEELASYHPALGLVAPETVPLMVCRLDLLPPPRPVDDLAIEPIRDPIALRNGIGLFAAASGIPLAAATRAMADGVFDEPALAYSAATRQGEMLSVAAMSRSGPLVYVDLMATSPEHRRQGIGHALLARTLAGHAASGATHAFLVASDAGQRLYERLGFRVLLEATVWEVPPTVAGPP